VKNFNSSRYKGKTLSDMDAMDVCIFNGIKFIKYFSMIYLDFESSKKEGIINKMQDMFDDISSIKLKETNRIIESNYLIDSFFSAGAVPSDFMINPTDLQAQTYDYFMFNVLENKDIRMSLNKVINNISIEYDKKCKILSKDDAVNKCYSLGKLFIDCFCKIYSNQSSNEVNSLAKKMQELYDEARSIKIKEENHPIFKFDIYCWFICIGENSSDYMDNPSVEQIIKYDDFMVHLLLNDDVKCSLSFIIKEINFSN